MCPIAEMTRSKLSSSNGSDWASPSSHSISTMASAPRSRAITSSARERSRPVTRAPSLAAGIVALPVPHANSSSTSIPDSPCARPRHKYIADGRRLCPPPPCSRRFPHMSSVMANKPALLLGGIQEIVQPLVRQHIGTLRRQRGTGADGWRKESMNDQRTVRATPVSDASFDGDTQRCRCGAIRPRMLMRVWL